MQQFDVVEWIVVSARLKIVVSPGLDAATFNLSLTALIMSVNMLVCRAGSNVAVRHLKQQHTQAKY